MTTDKDDKKEQTTTEDHAAEVAAFEASYEGSPAAPAKAPEPTAAPAVVPSTPAAAEPKEVPEPAKATEAAPTAPSPKAEDGDLRADLRKLQGQYGALNDLLRTALKTKEAEGKPAALTAVELKRMKAEYPDMAQHLEGDIADMLASLRTDAPDPKVIESLVSDRVANEMATFKTDTVTDSHENWKTDLWVGGDLGKTRTPDYEAWLKTMTPEQAQAFEASDRPGFVIRKLNDFYKWKSDTAAAAAATKAEAEKKANRLKDAVTPQGAARAGPATLSDEEAERLAFEKEFNS